MKNVLLRAAVTSFLRWGIPSARYLIRELVTEIEIIEKARIDDAKRYERRCQELEREAWDYEKRYYDLLYPDE